MNPDKESKSLRRLIANLESDPDIQAAAQAKPTKPQTDDRLKAIKEAVFQNVQDALAPRTDAVTTKSAPIGLDQKQTIAEGLIIWIGSFASGGRNISERLAASAGGSATESKIFDLPGHKLRLLFEPSGRTVLCTVLDGNDEPSFELAGATFTDSLGNIVGRVTRSQARLDLSDISKGVTLRDSAGKLIDTKSHD